MPSSEKLSTMKKTFLICLILQCLNLTGNSVLAAAPKLPTEALQLSVKPTISQPDQIVSLTGYFHILWGNAPKFILVDDHGLATNLDIDETVVKPFGNPRSLSQKRVTLTGKQTDGIKGVFKVLSIKVEKEGNVNNEIRKENK